MQVPPRPNKLVVTSINTFWDSKEAKQADTVRRELASLKETHGDQVDIGISTFNETLGAKLKRMGETAIKSSIGVTAGSGLIGAVAAIGGFLRIPIAIGAAALATVGVPVDGLGAAVRDRLANFTRGAPTGTFIENTDENPLELENQDKLSGPSEIAREVIVSQMKRFPKAIHVAHFNGHGHGNKTVAGLPAEQARKELTESVKRGGKKFEVAFYESCYAANFEFLHGQADVAQFAVAPEDEIPKSNTVTGRVPLGDMVSSNLSTSSAETAAKMMAQKAGQDFETGKEVEISNVPQRERHLKKHRNAKWRNMDTTVSAFDLGELRSGLSPQLNKLGSLLSKELKTNKNFSETLKQARQDNTIDRMGDLVDMGGFLGDVSESATPELKKALDSTLESLNEVVLTSRTSEGQPLSGLSFHSKPKSSGLATGGQNAHANPSLPQGWVEFVDSAF